MSKRQTLSKRQKFVESTKFVRFGVVDKLVRFEFVDLLEVGNVIGVIGHGLVDVDIASNQWIGSNYAKTSGPFCRSEILVTPNLIS